MITKQRMQYQFKSFITVPSWCKISYDFTVSGIAKSSGLVSLNKLSRKFTFEYLKDLNLLENAYAPFTDYTVTIMAHSGTKKKI